MNLPWNEFHPFHEKIWNYWIYPNITWNSSSIYPPKFVSKKSFDFRTIGGTTKKSPANGVGRGDDDCIGCFQKLSSSIGAICSDPVRFEVSELHSHFLLLYFGRKDVLKEERQFVQISSHSPAYQYASVLCTHIRIHVSWDLVHLDSLGSPDFPSRPKGSHPSTPRAACVCVCVYTNTPTHILSKFPST